MLNVVLYLHYFNLFLVLTAGLVSAVWGFILFFTTKAPNRPWNIALIVTSILALLQGIFGVILLLMGQQPGAGDPLYYLHFVYGGIVVLAVPVAVTYATSGKNPRRDILIFSLAALIVFAAGFRGWMTGPPVGAWPNFFPG